MASQKILKELDALMAREELSLAFKVFVSAWDSTPSLHSELWSRGFIIAITSDIPEIQNSFITQCKRILKKDPDNYDVLSKMAALYDASERYDKSLPIYQKMLGMKLPRDIYRDVEYSLAMLYNSTKEYSLAKKFLNAALRKTEDNPDFFTPYYALMGEIEGNLGNIAAAVYWYDTAITSDPYDSSWMRKCAIMLESNRELVRAREYWGKILNIPKERLSEMVCDEGRTYWKNSELQKDKRLAKQRLARYSNRED